MRIKTVYGLAALFKYYENIHSEYDRSLILETLAEKYFSNAIYKTDEDIVLNINGITLTEEEAVALVYDILVRSASYSSIHGYDLVKTIRKPDYFRLGIISYDLDTAKILSEIKKKLPNLPEDVRLRGRKLAGTISDVAKRNDKAAEACIGVTVLKSVDAEGQKRIDILCGAFADEFNTCAMLEHLGKSTDVKKIPKIFRKTEQYYRQQNCEKIMNDYFSTIGNMCDKHTEVISTYFAILRDDKYDELTGAELRWRKPEIVEAGNVNFKKFPAAYLASRYALFDMVEIAGKPSKEYIDDYIEELKDSLSSFKPDVICISENGKRRVLIEKEPEVELSQ